jgi:hypothetical protein
MWIIASDHFLKLELNSVAHNLSAEDLECRKRQPTFWKWLELHWLSWRQ